jgi:subtilase family serine protease
MKTGMWKISWLLAGLFLVINPGTYAQSVSMRGAARDGYAQPALYVNVDPSFATPYGPAQIRHAYGFDQVLASGTDGTGQTIAIVDAYGNPSVQSSLDTFCQHFGLPNTTLQIIGNNVGGNSSWALETALDVEWAHAIAPGAAIILAVANSNSDVDLLAAVDAAVQAGATIVSMSWGGPEFGSETTFDSHFNVPKVTFTASSGDSGESVSVEWPAVSPYVLSVGGTGLYLDINGNQSVPQVAWSGSGGGLSVVYSAPPWQNGWFQAGWPAARGVPDVSYVADPNTGLYVYDAYDGGWFMVGGTSVGAPQWAALIALVNQLRGAAGALTTPSSTIYSLAQGSITTPFTVNSAYFFDVTQGSNGSDPDDNAAFPYDLVTGVGTPVANILVPALAQSADFSLSATPNSQTIDPGASAVYTVTVTPNGSFSGNVYLKVDGLPAGAAASIGPNPVSGGSGSSTLTISTSSTTTPGGTYNLTITGTNGLLIHWATATLVVRPPDFSISASPTSMTAKQGTAAMYTFSVSPISGFAGSVNLGVSGLPTGATGSFSPNPITGGSGSSVLTVTTTGSSPLGKYTLTITGTSGLLIHSATVMLTVSAPNFSMSITPGSRTVIPGNSTNYTVSVSPVGSFSAAVNLGISGLPAGATASMSPNPITGGTGSALVTVATTSSILPGKYTFTITGTSGSLVHSVKATLTVPPPDFSLAASPSSRTITHGSSTTYQAKITPKNGFTGPVALSVTGLPLNATASFNPGSILTSGSSTLTITTTALTPAGTNQLSIVGASGALSHSKTATLIVK